MFSSSGTPDTIHLVVDGGTPCTELRVFNGLFRTVAEGLGRMETNLPHGLYKVRFRAGLLVREEYLDLAEGIETVQVAAPILDFSTPVPLRGTRTTRLHHEQAASDLCTRVHATPGNGSQVFLFVRSLEHQTESHPAAGISLHDAGGTLLVDLSLVGECHNDPQGMAPCCGSTIHLAPGTYRLRIQTDQAGTLEQSLVACAGWQTQVYLINHMDKSNHPISPADPLHTAILMVPIGTGFDPTMPDWKHTELARIGLAIGRHVVPNDTLAATTWEDRYNPMFALYGAHSLIHTERPDRALVQTVVDRLFALLGAHPDVAALNLWCNAEEVQPTMIPYHTPPMLCSSWKLVVEASANHAEIVPSRSFSSQIAAHAQGDGLWFVWNSPPETDLVPDQAVADLSLLGHLWEQIADHLPAEPEEPPEQSNQNHDLTTLERLVLDYLVHLSTFKSMSGEPPDRAEWYTNVALVQGTGLPQTSIGMAATGLFRKLAPVNAKEIASAILRVVVSIEQLEAMGMLSNNTTRETLQNLVAQALDHTAHRTDGQRLLQLQQHIESDYALALRFHALLHHPDLVLTAVERMAVLVHMATRTAVASLGRAPGVLAGVIQKHIQNMDATILLNPPVPPRAAWTWGFQVGAAEGGNDPDVQFVALIHAALGAFLRLSPTEQEQALADPASHTLREQAQQIAQKARLPRKERQPFVEACVKTIREDTIRLLLTSFNDT